MDKKQTQNTSANTSASQSADALWNKFCTTGKVEDYISYKLKSQGDGYNANNYSRSSY